MQKLFAEEQTKTLLLSYKKKLAVQQASNAFEEKRNDLFILMIDNFLYSPELWDDSTQLNIGLIGNNFIMQLKNQNFENYAINVTFVSCARFNLERYMISEDHDVSTPAKVKDFIIYNQTDFDETSSYYIDFIIKEMPLLIIKNILTSTDLKCYSDYNSNIQKLDKFNTEWSVFFEKKTQDVNKLKDTLEKQAVAFNFVGLYKGFSQLGDTKKKELRNSKIIMFLLGILLISPFIIEMLILHSTENNELSTLNFIALIPIISITVIFAYFFRIALNNFQSLRAQLVQIELRMSLCQFIQSYAEYAHEIKGKDKDLLVKFEEVVFSNIMASEDKIPSTFDGLEQLASLVSSFKNK